MIEKKTFKNVVYGHQAAHGVIEKWFIGGESFPTEDWDMEVTFTKKVRVPKVGDRVLSPSGISECEIAAIDGNEVWLRYSDGSHSTIDTDKLIYAS